MDKIEYQKLKRKLESEIAGLVAGAKLRRGKSICSDTVYSVMKALRDQLVIVVKVPAGKTIEQATIEALKSRLIIAKKLAGIKG